MNNTLKIAAVAASVLVVAYAAFSKNATMEHLSKQYPELDLKVAKKAYRRIMSNVISGKINVDNYTTDQFDQLLLQEVAKMSNK